MDGPCAPFGHWPVQLADPELGYAWYTQPATFVNQLLVERATVDHANRLHDIIDHVIERESEDIAAHGGLLIVHDWRQLSKYDSEARKAFVGRMRSREPGYLRGAVAVVPDTPLLRMAVQTANLVMAMRAGGKLEITTSVGPALAKHGVAVPTVTGWA